MKNTNVDFILLFEHQARELQALCLLKYELEKRGYSVKILYVKSWNWRAYRSVVVVTPYLYNNKEYFEFSRFNKGNSNKIINLQWEQVFNNDEDTIKFHMPKGLAQNVVHLAWGKYNKEQLIKYGVYDSLIFVTGNINMDFCCDKLKKIFKNKLEIANIYKKYNLNNNNTWILFISSFSYTDSFIVQMVNDTSLDKKRTSSFAQFSIESQKVILDWFDRLLKSRRDIEIIYRPHPAELSNTRLKKFEQSHTNFKIISEETVQQWIRICEYSFTWFSTSIVDAFFMGKDCQILRPIKLENSEEVSIMNNAYKITEYNQFEKIISGAHREFPIDACVIKKYYGEMDGMAYVRVADVLQEIYKEPEKQIYKCISPKYTYSIREKLYTILFEACNYVKLSKLMIGDKKKKFINTENNIYHSRKREKNYCKKLKQILNEK